MLRQQTDPDGVLHKVLDYPVVPVDHSTIDKRMDVLSGGCMLVRNTLGSIPSLIVTRPVTNRSTTVSTSPDMIARKATINSGRAKAQFCIRCHRRDGIHCLAMQAGWNRGRKTLIQL